MKARKNYWNVVYELARLDFKLKYYGSALGFLWSLLKPLFMLGILYVVFFSFLKVGIPNYEIYLLLGIIMWNFFADATTDATQNLTAKSSLLQKTNLPPFIVVMSSILQSLWTFLITLAVFFVFFFAFGFHLTWSVVILVPLVLLLALLVFGTALIIVPLYMRFRDFRHLWDIFLQMLFWITPIVYQSTAVPAQYFKWYLLNPMARIIVDARTAVIYQSFPEAKQLIITTIIVGIVAAIGSWVFRRYGRAFVEEL